MPNVITQWENANQNLTEIAFHTHQDDYNKKGIISAGEDVDNWNPHILLMAT